MIKLDEQKFVPPEGVAAASPCSPLSAFFA